jgi:hypothetical protein
MAELPLLAENNLAADLDSPGQAHVLDPGSCPERLVPFRGFAQESEAAVSRLDRDAASQPICSVAALRMEVPPSTLLTSSLNDVRSARAESVVDVIPGRIVVAEDA